ncbi:MAG: TrpR YerC/YecD [Lachnospiraceae bacterium]|nr:TrpR YerC/YecD [Lachnospiraceae bacterium]
MTKEQRTGNLDHLYEAFTKLKTKEEAAAFLTDLCTIREIEDMAQRLMAAELLDKGENYLAIASGIGISTATISRVSRALNYGAGGYRLMLTRLSEEE